MRTTNPARRIFLACAAAVASLKTFPALGKSAEKKRYYLYVLRLVPRLQQQSAWTDADNKAVDVHFGRLKRATDEGSVILAGRTDEPLDQSFGLVVFEALDEDAARTFMETDPAVVAGVMTATLHPYSLALLRKGAVRR